MVARRDFDQFGLSDEQLRTIRQAEGAARDLLTKLCHGMDNEGVMGVAILVSQDIHHNEFPPKNFPSKQRMHHAHLVVQEIVKLANSLGIQVNQPFAAGYVLGLFEGLIRETMRRG